MALLDIKITGLTEADLLEETNHQSRQQIGSQRHSAAGSGSKLSKLGIFKSTTAAWMIAGAAAVVIVGHSPQSTTVQPVTRTAGRGVIGSGTSSAQTFMVQVGAPLAPGQTCGGIGCPGYYRGLVSIAPSFEISGDGKIRISLNGTSKTLEQRDASGLAAIGWSVPSPEGSVQEVRAIFNTGSVATKAQPYELVIPPAATRLSRIDVLVLDSEGNLKQLVFWPSFKPVRN